MKKFLLILWIFISWILVAVWYSGYFNYINYNEKFPNWESSLLLQSEQNWWSSPETNEKNILTPEGCRRIVSENRDLSFIPTRTMEEWVAFKKNPPHGISIHLCYECWDNGVIGHYPDWCIDDGGPNGVWDGIEFYCDAHYVRACLSYESCPWRWNNYSNKPPRNRNERFGAYGDTGHNFSCGSKELKDLYHFMKNYSDY